MKRLNIFVDETGEFGFSNKSSKLYGVSFTFHEQDDSIIEQLNKLNENLKQIGYSNMIHMADLIMKRGDYSHFSIDKRKKIFNSIYQFSRRIPVKYCSLFVDKKFVNNKSQLRVNLSQKINNMIRKNEEYFNKYESLAEEKELSKFGITYLNSNDLILSCPINDDMTVPSYNSQEMILKSFSDYKLWSSLLNVNYVADLNKVISQSKIKDFIKKNDIMMDNQIYEMANIIRKENKKIVLLGGPSSSGKTTSTRKLALYLSAIGLNPVCLSLDDYFKERELTPKDENGEYDFESLAAIDLDLFNAQMTSLLNGEEVNTPTYNFLTGKKEYNHKIIKLGDNDILLIEGLHCLNEELSKSIPYSRKIKVYISPFMPLSIDRHNHISTVDIRLMRRIVRDNRTRGYGVVDTLKSWDKVRNGETKYVFPYTNEANVILNTAYIYEIGVLRVYVEPLLYSVPIDSKYYNEARRLINYKCSSQFQVNI